MSSTTASGSKLFAADTALVPVWAAVTSKPS